MDPKKLNDRVRAAIRGARARMPQMINDMYTLAFDESASVTVRQYAARYLLQHNAARPMTSEDVPDFEPEPMGAEVRARLESILRTGTR